MAGRNNRVTIFSNGIADFRRVYRADAPRRVSIPVNADHIGDILASLNVVGPVKLAMPPGFTPRNAARGRLELDGEDVLCEFGRKLRGARVRIEPVSGGGAVEGTLVGLDAEPRGTGGQAISARHLVVLTAAGMQRVPQSQVGTFQVLDESVQIEIDKALARAFDAIRPQSTTVNLEVAPVEAGGEFVVHYTVPAAAWKMTYRLRDAAEGMRLDGVCVVDNNTEEDWDDFLISVVTGEPVTFATDLADSKVPRRQRVNVVNEHAQGAAEAEIGMAVQQRVAAAAGAGEDVFDLADTTMDDFGDVELAGLMDEPAGYGSALAAEATVREIGDFSVFEHPTPVTLRAGESMALPVFSCALGEARHVLYYRRADHPERPFRAVLLHNESGQHLGRGVCTVYESDVYAGSAVLPACQRGEEALVCHALQTGVRIETTRGAPESRVVSVALEGGYARQVEELVRVTRYAVQSVEEDAYRLLVDHHSPMPGPVLACAVEDAAGETPTEPTRTLRDGHRFELELQAGARNTLRIEERWRRSQSTRLDARLLARAIRTMEGSLPELPELRRCAELLVALDDRRGARGVLDKELETATEEQKRARELLAADPQNADWKQDLRRTEDEIRAFSRTRRPELEAGIAALERELAELLGRIACEWSGG